MPLLRRPVGAALLAAAVLTLAALWPHGAVPAGSTGEVEVRVAARR